MKTWTEQPGPLPTLPGMAPGIVESWDRTPAEKPRATVQCSACYRTLTDELFWAVKACNFATDDGETGAHKYRRCDDCRTARKHPQREDPR